MSTAAALSDMPALRAANLAASLSYVARRFPESAAPVHGEARWSWGT
jgi:hypothetical protein